MWVVTGAGGFLGGALVAELRSRGRRVRALVRGPAPWLTGVADEVFHADVRVPTDPDRALGDLAGRDVVLVHAAGRISIADMTSPEVHETNVTGTQHVIDACRRHGVRRLVYVSSVHALPEPPHGTPVVEVDDVDPRTLAGAYAQTRPPRRDGCGRRPTSIPSWCTRRVWSGRDTIRAATSTTSSGPWCAVGFG